MSFYKGFASELIKLAFHENWGLGGEWSANAGPVDTGNPVLHEQSTPYDVEWKNFRRDYFHNRIMPQSSGKVREGQLGPGTFAKKKEQ